MQKYLSLFRSSLYWLVLGLFVFILLYPKFPLVLVPGTYVAIRLEDLLIALTLGFWFITVLPNLKQFLRKTTTQAILIFWSVGMLSLFSGIFLTNTVTPHLGILHFLRRVEVMSLFFVAYYSFTNIKQLKLWMKVMLVATAIIIIYGYGQQYLSFPVISTTNKEFSKGLILFLSPEARVNSTFAGHYDLAGYLAVFLILITSLGFYFKKIWNLVATLIVGILALVLLAMTAARISFLAAFMGILPLLWFNNQKKLILAMIFLVALVFAFSPELRHRTVATLTVNLLEGGGPKYSIPEQVANPTKNFSSENAASGSATFSGVPVDIAPGEPLNTTELGVYRSYGIRLNEEWPRAIRAFLKNPLLGTGYSSISISSDNDYLRSLGEVGILGTLSFATILFIIVKRLVVFIKHSTPSLIRYFALGVLASLFAIAINATFIDIFESSKLASSIWLLLGIALAATEMEQDV